MESKKHRQGAQVSKRYHPPQTRLLLAKSLSEIAKAMLREVAGALDPMKLQEEIRAVQAHLVDAGRWRPPSQHNVRTARSFRLRWQSF